MKNRSRIFLFSSLIFIFGLVFLILTKYPIISWIGKYLMALGFGLLLSVVVIWVIDYSRLSSHLSIKPRLLDREIFLNKISSEWYYFILLLLTPVILIIINDSWMFTPFTRLYNDPWGYTAFFLDLPNLLNYYTGERVISRIPWLISGFFLYSVLPFPYSNYGLHLFYYYLAIFSFYYIIRESFGYKTAIISSLLFGTYPYFLLSIGWDQPDGAVGAMWLLSLALILKSKNCSDKKSMLFLFLSGFAQLFSILMYPQLPLVFCFFLYYFHIFFQSSCRTHFKNAISFFFGGIFCIISFGLLLYYFSKNFVSLFNQFLLIISLSKEVNFYWVPNYDWFSYSPWLVIPAMVLLVSLYFLSDYIYAQIIESNSLTELIVKGINVLSTNVFFLFFYVFVAAFLIILTFLGQPWIKHFIFLGSYYPIMFFCISALIHNLIVKIPDISVLIISVFFLGIVSFLFSPQIIDLLYFPDFKPIVPLFGLCILFTGYWGFIIQKKCKPIFILVTLLFIVVIGYSAVLDQEHIESITNLDNKIVYGSIISLAKITSSINVNRELPIVVDMNASNSMILRATSIVASNKQRIEMKSDMDIPKNYYEYLLFTDEKRVDNLFSSQLIRSKISLNKRINILDNTDSIRLLIIKQY